MTLILASGSQTRLRMLRDAGVDVAAVPAHVDEAAVKEALKAEGATAEAAAEALAELKAARVARHYGPDDVVLGADQILDCNGVWFDKPADLDHARAHLQALRGKPHRLVSVAVAFRNNQRIWHQASSARLTMRPFSDDFLEHYLTQAGEAVLSSVGAYQLEGLGAQLFSSIDGDHFTILGLPLIPLLDFLRIQGLLLK